MGLRREKKRSKGANFLRVDAFIYSYKSVMHFSVSCDTVRAHTFFVHRTVILSNHCASAANLHCHLADEHVAFESSIACNKLTIRRRYNPEKGKGAPCTDRKGYTSGYYPPYLAYRMSCSKTTRSKGILTRDDPPMIVPLKISRLSLRLSSMSFNTLSIGSDTYQDRVPKNHAASPLTTREERGQDGYVQRAPGIWLLEEIARKSA